MEYTVKNVTVTVQDNIVTIEVFVSDDEGIKISLSKEEAKRLLGGWEPVMKSRGPFLIFYKGECFRSYDIKSIVRCLRKVFKQKTGIIMG